MNNKALIKEQYRDIRPALNYPACPRHPVKGEMFEVLLADEIGMTLTESYSMSPVASVSGFHFSHPESQDFNMGPTPRILLIPLTD